MDSRATRPPLLVGLTGGIGSGKTTVANLFAGFGAPLIDTDLIAHSLTGAQGAAMPAIAEAFGPAVVAPDGRLDRSAMRDLAFSDPRARKRLEAILHPMIREQTTREIAAAASRPYAIVVVPLLIESGTWRGWVDRVVVVDCPVDVQIERVSRRNSLAREQIDAIISAQASREARLAAADDVVDNSGDESSLDSQVRTLHERYLQLAADREVRAR